MGFQYSLVGKENVVDGILCKGSDKCLFYNTFIHTIQSATKNKICTENC